jgi:hypothetical protein
MRPLNVIATKPGRRAVLAALLGVVALGGATALPAQVGIDDLEVHITLGTPQGLTQVIPVRSESDSAQQIRITVSDWSRDSSGSNKFHDYGAHESSCRERLQVFPATLQLGARATEFVRVSYTPQGDTDAGCWAMVVVEVVRPPEQRVTTSRATATFNVLTGVKVYVHPATTTLEGDVLSADVEEIWDRVRNADGSIRDSTRAQQIAVRFENTGTAHLIVKSNVEIRDASTQLLREIKGPDAYITPRAFRDVLIRIPDLPAGRYIAVVLFDYGGVEIKAAQVEFAVP